MATKIANHNKQKRQGTTNDNNNTHLLQATEVISCLVSAFKEALIGTTCLESAVQYSAKTKIAQQFPGGFILHFEPVRALNPFFARKKVVQAQPHL